MSKTAIIGGGSSGLAAAIFIKTNDPSAAVTIFDRMDRVGKKLLATGNGRCNLTNTAACDFGSNNGKKYAEHYHGADRNFAVNALSKFGINELRDFLLSLGIPTTFENDKLFPLSLNASTVVDVLRLKCEQLGVIFKLSQQIDSIKNSSDKFIISGEAFDNVIVATGGKSQENLGSNGSGYKLLEAFGHKCTKLYPSITQIRTETEFVRQLKGLKIDADCKLYLDNKPIAEQFGQVLFADYGLSGPPIFFISRYASVYGDRCKISLDLMPNYSMNDVFDLVKNVANNPFCDDLTLENLLTPIINKRIGQVIIKHCGYRLSTKVNNITDRDIKRICAGLKAFELNVTGVKGYNIAQVTAGGIMTDKFDYNTMMSKLKPRLYAIGEVLDIDGDCGGYNLQWAFSSAFSAAKNITTGKHR